jgi:site-specific recombinase XerC
MASHDVSLWMRDFRAAERRRGMRDTSLGKRVGIVRRWVAYIGDPFATTVDWRDVEAFVDASTMRAAKSRYDAVSHLRMFYLWAQRAGLAGHDPTTLVVRPRITPGLPRPAHDTDLALAVAIATGPVRAAIVLGATCGLRCLELARLRWVDVGHDVIRVRGKGDRERVLPLPAAARDALDGLDRVDEWVLPWREAPDVSPGRRVSHAINAFFDSIGCETTAHQLRHWAATRAYAHTGDLGAVQDYLGHASPATTRIYARLDVSRLRAVAAGMTLPG